MINSSVLPEITLLVETEYEEEVTIGRRVWPLQVRAIPVRSHYGVSGIKSGGHNARDCTSELIKF